MNNLVSIAGFEKVINDYGYLYTNGVVYTIALAIGSVLVGLLIALLVSPLRMSRFKVLRFISLVYIEFIRATPLMVQLMIIYFGIMPLFSAYIPKVVIWGIIETNRYIPAIISIGVNSGAYITEIIRSGINAVDKGQTEAARSLGMSQVSTMTFIVVPQAIRNILPALGNELVMVIKETSVAGIVLSVKELMYMAGDIQTRSYIIVEPLLVAAALYFLMTFPLSKFIAYVERRLNRGYER